MFPKEIKLPLDFTILRELRAGDLVRLSGPLLSGRDAAHLRLINALKEGKPLPVNLAGETIYYVGPCPTPPGRVIGSAGPTTSGRMDSYTPALLELGLKGMIGKGHRSPEVISAMIKFKAVYFAGLGGAGALIARSIKKAEIIAYPDLGPEAIYRMEVQDLPLIVAIDICGNDLYQKGRSEYCQKAL
ncbi:MAG TPA: Fe-S-containing hydro-lyase [Bacillota bacterium]|nr:Fe-S-containing hydro-lyase [Bacillota bacterium]